MPSSHFLEISSHNRLKNAHRTLLGRLNATGWRAVAYVLGIATLNFCSVPTDFRGRPYVTLQGGVNQFMEPQFSFEDATDPTIAQLQKGSRITLACTGRGDIAKTPISEDCQFVR
ncbi:hypothetical protein ALQ15_103159 [Pseudomonas syringae pv. actinidiae]|uniref:Uncharacterized protein n=1 Tax=Pseudomonas syringae pv. actinidiae TaxID=103796 RepID=A0A7Z6UB41_PSESF|nr:hypothetical protein ALQ15_103159 [Pseudomonas syringae pv. actinidiae]